MKQDSSYLDYKLSLVNEFQSLAWFSCGDGSIDKFIHDDAEKYQKEKLASSYVLTHNQRQYILAYIAVSAAELPLPPKSKLRKFFYYKAKKYSSYPSVRLCRFAVADKAHGLGIGRIALNLLVCMLQKSTDIAFRFLVLDAYREVVPFYIKCGFTKVLDDDICGPTTPMYLDLCRLTAIHGDVDI